MRGRLQRIDCFLEVFQRVGVEGVVDPTSLRSIKDQTSLFQHSQVEGEPRLPRFERVCEIAHTLLAFFQLFQYQ